MDRGGGQVHARARRERVRRAGAGQVDVQMAPVAVELHWHEFWVVSVPAEAGEAGMSSAHASTAASEIQRIVNQP